MNEITKIALGVFFGLGALWLAIQFIQAIVAGVVIYIVFPVWCKINIYFRKRREIRDESGFSAGHPSEHDGD